LKGNNKMNKQEANAKLAKLLEEANQKIKECEKLADEHGLNFSSPIGVYGMGGYYYGKVKKNVSEVLQAYLTDNPTASKEQIKEFLEDEERWQDSDSQDGWRASSQSC
jgi:hypothetical protein